MTTIETNQAPSKVVPLKGKKNPVAQAAEFVVADDKKPPPAPAPAPSPASLTPVVQLPEPPDTVCPTLVKILSWKRPYDTPAEKAFMGWLVTEIVRRGAAYERMAQDCVVVDVDRPDGKPSSTLFSCHTDTVHWLGKDEPLNQKVVYDPAFGHIFLDKADKSAGNCLGADDGAGVWLMLEMIQAKVPGTYIFHRGEERGGVGSNAMLNRHKDWLNEFDVAVAFDRPNINEVITHQGGMRCCSDKFAKALAKALNEHGLFEEPYEPSDRGVFTDTKVYRKVINECTNLGVGYFKQHGRDETLDYGHLVRMRDAVTAIDWEALPVDRDCATPDPTYYGSGQRGTYVGGRGSSYGGYGAFDDDTDDYDQGRFSGAGWESWRSPASKTPAPSPAPAPAPKPMVKELAPEIEDEILSMRVDDLQAWIEEDAASAAFYMIDLASEIKALQAKVKALKATLQ